LLCAQHGRTPIRPDIVPNPSVACRLGLQAVELIIAKGDT